jgi:hypothetical protein
VNRPCSSHRTAVARPIRTSEDARRALALATDNGTLDCVVVACVDADHLPLTMFIFDGRAQLDDDLELAIDAIVAAAASADSPLAAIFLGSSRPRAEFGPTPTDELRWARMADTCRDAGIELLDWLLLNQGAVCSVADGLKPGPGW